MSEWIVLQLDRLDTERPAWMEVGRAEAPDAGTAFRSVVLRPNQHVRGGVQPGEYLIASLNESARIGVELNLRDLNAIVP